MKLKTLLLAAAAATLVATPAMARDQIRIVGSSTVFPFSTAVAEQFGRKTGMATPVVESTGTGGGFKLFCAGTGPDHPDMSNASRAIKSSEYADCQRNGVNVSEVKIGYDGIVVANSKQHSQYDLTRKQLFLALAKEIQLGGDLVPNPYVLWSDVDPSLPSEKIAVLGPPPTSGTRDAFVELVMEEGCKEAAKAFNVIDAKMKEDKKWCYTIREDGVWIDAGENDVLIVQKLVADPVALGVFGYSFLEESMDKIQGSRIEGVEPGLDAIADGTYPVSRPLFFYVKLNHVGVIPGMQEFVAEFTSESAWGPDGYLARKGLIPLSDDERAAEAAKASQMTPFTM